MALGTFIAGPYTSAYASSSLGMAQDGFQIRLRNEKELVNQSDIYGDTILDSVYRGGNCTVSLVGIEFGKMGQKSAIWPFGELNNSSLPAMGFLGTVGYMDVGSSLYAALVLTAVAGTTAAATPATMTANQAVMAEQTEIEYAMTSRLRTVPLTMRLYPYTVTNPSGMPSGTYEVWFINA